MERKYEFTEETRYWYDIELKRIEAVRDFGDVKAGDLGGWIEKEKNLSHEGNCWVYDEATVYDNAEIRDEAKTGCNAEIRDWAKIYGNAVIKDDAVISGIVEIEGNAEIGGNAKIEGNAEIGGNTKINGYTEIYGNTKIRGDAVIKTTNDYITIGPIGSRNRNNYTTAFKTKSGTAIQCGCFYGSVDEFIEKVKETHKDNEFAKEYLAFAELVKIRFGE